MSLVRVNPHGGFSLLEVMVCLSIIAIAFTAAFALQSTSLSYLGDAQFGTVACFLAQQKMAELENSGPDDIVSGSGHFGENYPEYRWNIEVNDTALFEEETATGLLKQIDLNILFEDNRYDYHLRFYCFVPKRGQV